MSKQSQCQDCKVLWVVTKGGGWRGRPRHLVLKASWNLPMFALDNSVWVELPPEVIRLPSVGQADVFKVRRHEKELQRGATDG